MHHPLWRLATRLLGATVLLFASHAFAQPAAPASATPLSSGEILQELRSFRELGSVLYVAAHPDDENTRLIAYLARGRGYRTGYLSLTRGDGGQNLIGTELRDSLGLIRTQELIAARRIDGAQQFFTRANDFGFSKDYRETLSIWNRDQVLADMIRVIRTFRPDVLVTRFSPQPGTTHGHHTASAILALEAFTLAADPAAFSKELGHLPPWQAKRVLWNTGPSGASRTGQSANPTVLRLDVGGFNPLLGESFGEIAARSRTMHKSQGFGSVGTRGTAYEHFQLLAGEPATTDILDGIDTTWSRIPGAAALGPLTDAALKNFSPQNPAASIPALLEIRSALAALPTDPILADKRAHLDRILTACLGLHWETVIPQAEAVPGETLKLRHTLIARNNFPVRWLATRYPTLATEIPVATDLAANVALNQENAQPLPPATSLTQPYWLRSDGTAGMFAVADPALIGLPENPPAFPVEHFIEIAGQTLIVADEPVQVIDDPVKGEIRRRLAVIPPVSLGFTQNLELFSPGSAKTVAVEVTAARTSTTGTLRIEAPSGWKTSPSSQPFALGRVGEKSLLTFTVSPQTSASSAPATASLTAAADIDNVTYRNRRIDIRYDHIPPQLLQPPASLKAVSIDLQIRGKTVGYLPGAGDLVADSLTRMGYSVTFLTGADLTIDRLRSFDTVVLGIRAFNTRTDLVPQLPALFDYAKNGGTVIVQYNTTADLPSAPLAPYDLKISRDRVTEENATVTILAPNHPALNTPNKITSADFDGWVQERGLYFPNQWAPEFTPLIACADAGETPLSGGLLVAQHGKGWFVYTGLSWFRELPEGVPGAYRLFANLVSLGK
ncbi:LmbE family protein [Nibricoccus aquaticus]|uniref:LmbE family protein n=1 Tax=Nibricoccus aquaticus TaxID=2576891 RepID=A0A290Q5Q6_9BACT|nr:PIG-L family deacetylase [Nibricoccus aquaticus]ATC64005.1 LmbE family protein [Nibricoccus aquaticus]